MKSKAPMHERHHKERMALHTSQEKEARDMYARHDMEVGGEGDMGEAGEGGPRMGEKEVGKGGTEPE